MRHLYDSAGERGWGNAMRSPVYALVQDLGLFKILPEPEAQNVLTEARLRKIALGGSVFTQGAPALRFFLRSRGA